MRFHKNLKSLLNQRWDNEYNDKNDERLFERNFQWEARKQKCKNFKLSTISPFNIRRILRVYLDYTWKKWKQWAPKWIGNWSNKRKLFEYLIKKLEFIGFNMIYVDEDLLAHKTLLYILGDISTHQIPSLDLAQGSIW